MNKFINYLSKKDEAVGPDGNIGHTNNKQAEEHALWAVQSVLQSEWWHWKLKPEQQQALAIEIKKAVDGAVKRFAQSAGHI